MYRPSEPIWLQHLLLPHILWFWYCSYDIAAGLNWYSERVESVCSHSTLNSRNTWTILRLSTTESPAHCPFRISQLTNAMPSQVTWRNCQTPQLSLNYGLIKPELTWAQNRHLMARKSKTVHKCFPGASTRKPGKAPARRGITPTWGFSARYKVISE